MTRFIEQAIQRAGLSGVIPARKRGDLDAVQRLLAAAGERGGIDLLVLGALADAIRAEESGDVVRVHEAPTADVTWPRGCSDLDVLRAIAVARATGPVRAPIGVDWGVSGLELAQVALGFGATDLTGPITRKNGLLIHEDDLRKVKGKGMVSATALKRREIAALVRNAGRTCEFVDEDGPSTAAPEEAHGAAHA
jgi:hypothetical protein